VKRGKGVTGSRRRTNGVVRLWHDEQGWGVLDADDTPGGCWAHFDDVHMDGYATLEAGQAVDFRWDRKRSNGFSYRASDVWPLVVGSDEPDAVTD
jgi:CspA family cold shock protein